MTESPKLSAEMNKKRYGKEAVYRGVRVQSIAGPTRFTHDQIKQAVETAIAKHADDLARQR